MEAWGLTGRLGRELSLPIVFSHMVQLRVIV